MLDYVIPYSYLHLLTVFQDIYIPPMQLTTAGSTIPIAPTLPTTTTKTTTTTIQGSKKTHETPATTYDTEITTMDKNETTQEIATNEPNISTRKNDSTCLLHRIISSNYLLLSNTFTFDMLYLYFFKCSMKNPDSFAMLMLI